jgi:tetraacyldisaccharide 4'-kinase
LILSSLSGVYGAAATWRRRWYEREPGRRRSLTRPVVSVGSLRVGGSGKTPVVAHIARLLFEHGYRPSILTRGYGRRRRADGVTVVSDGRRVLADLSRAGDEPLMLARALPGVPVIVTADRYAGGLLAERRFGATVHLLDDGFQHVQLARTVDLLLVDESDLTDGPLPGGRLREPLRNAAAADAVLVTSEDPSAPQRIGGAVGVATAFRIARALGTPSTPVPIASRVFAVAGVARPERFFGDLQAAGWQLGGSLAFRDHHHFSRADVARMEAGAVAAGASAVMTTEKDAIRLDVSSGHRVPIVAVPLIATVEPAAGFRSWLIDRL